jgi:hypothetical protein
MRSPYSHAYRFPLTHAIEHETSDETWPRYPLSVLTILLEGSELASGEGHRIQSGNLCWREKAMKLAIFIDRGIGSGDLMKEE